MINVISNVIEQ